MGLGSKKSGLNRVKWDNKSNSQKQKILEKHYSNLGKTTPKYIQGNITNKQLNNALKSLNNEYNRQIKKEHNINSKYSSLKRNYNKMVKDNLNRILSGRTPLEKEYLKGNELTIPTIRNQSFKADRLTFTSLGREQFTTLKAKEERIKQIESDLKKMNKMMRGTDDKIYNERGNRQVFNDMLNASNFDENDNLILKEMYKNLTPFEQEIFVKKGLSNLKDKYLREGKTQIDEDNKEKMFNAMYGIMRGVVKDNRGKEMLVSVSGKVWLD